MSLKTVLCMSVVVAIGLILVSEILEGDRERTRDKDRTKDKDRTRDRYKSRDRGRLREKETTLDERNRERTLDMWDG